MREKQLAPRKRISCLGWLAIVLGGSIVLQVILLGAGYIYQTQTTRADFEQFPAPGQLVDVGGYDLHIVCQGEGSPTVVVDAASNWVTGR